MSEYKKILKEMQEDTGEHDLNDSYKKQPNAEALVRYAIEDSAKNEKAYSYVAGMLDALRYAKLLTYEQYDKLYDEIVMKRMPSLNK